MTDLAINELEDLKGNGVELVVDGADDGLDGALDGLDARLEQARVLLGKVVKPREAHHRLHRRHVEEVQVSQPLLPLPLPLRLLHLYVLKIQINETLEKSSMDMNKKLIFIFSQF